jgi:hypothetical protein
MRKVLSQVHQCGRQPRLLAFQLQHQTVEQPSIHGPISNKAPAGAIRPTIRRDPALSQQHIHWLSYYDAVPVKPKRGSNSQPALETTASILLLSAQLMQGQVHKGKLPSSPSTISIHFTTLHKPLLHLNSLVTNTTSIPPRSTVTKKHKYH